MITSNYITAVIRTLAGYLVGLLLSVPAAAGIERAAGIDDAHARAWLVSVLVFVLGTAYYAIVHALERKWPAAGTLLALPRPPSYDPVPLGRRSADQADAIAAVTGSEVVRAEP